jgi:hypothetical protein
MAIRIFDQAILNAQGALVDLNALSRQPDGVHVAALAAPRKARALFLRWQTSPGAGLPSEPFKVWRRPAFPFGDHHPVGHEILFLTPLVEVIQFDVPLASVRLTVHSNAGGTVVVGVLSGPPVFESVVTMQTRTLPPGGVDLMEFQAPLITGLFLINVSSFDALTGMTSDELEKVQGWQLVETVGLPVTESDWAPLGQSHGIKQGLVGAEVPALDAAIDRYRRGVNPAGWLPNFPDGTPAPAWQLPDAKRLVEESATELLPMLRDVAAQIPSSQASKLFTFTIDPPQNPAGAVMPIGQTGKADLSPIGLLAMGVATDPLVAVALGYGTGYPDEDIPPIVLGDRSLLSDPTRSDWDWMITGLWDKGLDGNSDAVEFAALVPRPPLGIPAPAPADFAVDFQASLRPPVADMPWFASIRANWERFPLAQLASVASFAAARHPTGAPGAAEALLARHALAGGHHPIGNVRNQRDPEPTRQSATDAALAVPNDPGSVAMTYAAATQNIFGLWSPWVQGPIMVGQPDLPPVQFLSADLRPTDPGGSGAICPAQLIFEISVDWRVRSVSRIELRGRLFEAATRSAAPPAASPPSGLQKALGGAMTVAQIIFAGDTPSVAGGIVEPLNVEGTAVVVGGDAAQGTSRRYRVTIPGFSLDFAATPHIGLILEAREVERIAPQHLGPWSPTPRLAYASDPRSRPTVVIDIVQLASLPDAAGECHAHISWAETPGAIGYALYESTETRIHTSHPGLPQPTPDRTLSQRLTTIKQAFKSSPLRRDFIRRNANLLTATQTDVTLPRGSRDIHLYTVLPVMAGGNEGPWPSGANADKALIPYVAPRISEPAPPTIEVQMISDKSPAPPDYRVRLRIGTRASVGAHPTRIDVYRVRVDDAARALDSMGPPIAQLSASGGGWTVAQASAGTWIDTVTGLDRPDGSWRNVWYRAVAWSDDDPIRGVLKGRSLPSPAVSVLVPPAGPPDLSIPVMSWPGGDPAAVLISFSSAAPVAPTPIGPHILSVEATPTGAAPLVKRQTSLDTVDLVQPATGSGVWRIDGTPNQYRLLLRRAAMGDAVSVTLRLTDPLGRVAERVIMVPSGSIVPLPILSAIDSFTVSGRGKVFGFSTNAPDDDGAGGTYRIHVELTPVAACPCPCPCPSPVAL